MTNEATDPPPSTPDLPLKSEADREDDDGLTIAERNAARRRRAAGLNMVDEAIPTLQRFAFAAGAD